mgnify:CR=1 FL=1
MRIVCRACNEGWMKANVDAAIPVLTRMNYGYWGLVTESERTALVRWIAQFCMSYEFADRETVMIPQAVRTQFAKNGELAGHWIIAIGVALPVTGQEPIYHRGMGLVGPDGSVEPIQVTVFMFGMLFAAAVYSAVKIPKKLVTTVSDMRLTTIYPPKKSGVIRPTWQHSEYTIPVVTNALSDAFIDWEDSP